MIGLLRGTAAPVETFRMASKNMHLHGIEVGSREMFDEMNVAIGAHGMGPVVDRVFDIDAVHDALRYLESGAHFGKVGVRF